MDQLVGRSEPVARKGVAPLHPKGGGGGGEEERGHAATEVRERRQV